MLGTYAVAALLYPSRCAVGSGLEQRRNGTHAHGPTGGRKVPMLKYESHYVCNDHLAQALAVQPDLWHATPEPRLVRRVCDHCDDPARHILHMNRASFVAQMTLWALQDAEPGD